jgi:cell division protein FtsL
MSWLNAGLFSVLVASCLLLVNTSHEARLLYAEIDRAKTEKLRMDAQFKVLEAEQQQQTASMNVQRRAEERLRMRTPGASNTERVTDRGAAPTAAGTTPLLRR